MPQGILFKLLSRPVRTQFTNGIELKEIKNCLPIKREPRSRLWQPFGNAHAYQCECGATVTTQSRLVDICLLHKWPSDPYLQLGVTKSLQLS